MPARRVRHKIVVVLTIAVLLVGLALAWSFSPLRGLLDLPKMVLALQTMAHSAGLPAAIVVFALALMAAVPLTFLTVLVIVAFGPGDGFVCVMVGAQLGALCSYGLGVALGRDALRLFGGARVNSLSQKLGERGLLAVIVARLVPVAPFAVVNMVAGASHIRLRDLVLGTLLGMVPGTLAIAVFSEKIIDTLLKL
jgi:uncharacterized membrane protein YdjX (TVP38/TMEM64 family)